MNYLKIEELQNHLKGVSKDVVIKLLYKRVPFNYDLKEIEREIIHIKLEDNLEAQRVLLDEIDTLPTGFQYHDKWTKLNEKLNKLTDEWQKLYDSLGGVTK